MFSCIWLHYENAIFLLVSHIFLATKQNHSQHTNPFSNQNKPILKSKPFLKKQKSKQNHSQYIKPFGQN